MSSIKRQYQVFIDEMIKHGDQVKAYKVAYPKASDEAARVNSYKLLQNATIQSAVKKGADKIRSLAENKAVEELKDEIKANVLSALQKRELLLKIATGAIEIPTKRPAWDSEQRKYVMVPVIDVPDFGERMKAIDLDNKMAGDFAADKKDITSNNTNITKIILEDVDGSEI